MGGSAGRLRRVLVGTGSLVIATAIWLPSLHLFFSGRTDSYFAYEGVPPGAQMLAERHLRLWADPDLRKCEIDRMRRRNAEWDFMGRSFLAWSLANMALRDPDRTADYLGAMDRIIDETVAIEAERGHRFFLMAYGQTGRFVHPSQRSLFIDGEIALMLGLRATRSATR